MSYEMITKHISGMLSVTNENIYYKNKTYKGASFIITIPLL